MTAIFAIAAPVRGEARYLLEWIGYHRALGINAFLLADNGGDDNTSALLIALDRCGVAKRFDWRNQTKFQLRFYTQALHAARHFAQGLFFIDVDEFLRPDGSRSIADIAKGWLSDSTISAVALNWAIYGSSDRQHAGDGLVIERFTRRAVQHFGPNKHAKAFARVDSCTGPAENPHAVTLSSGRYVNTRGEDVIWDIAQGHRSGITMEVVWDLLRVNHFAVKSREEFEVKRARGRLLTVMKDGAWERYFNNLNRNDVEDSMPADFVHRTKSEIQRIVENIGSVTL